MTDVTKMSDKELINWAGSWSIEAFSEEIATSLWDMPSIESREEFKAALAKFHRPLFELASRLSASLSRERKDVEVVAAFLSGKRDTIDLGANFASRLAAREKKG